MTTIRVSYGVDERSIEVPAETNLGEAIIQTGLPLEQPCAGRGTCLKCKVIAQGALSELDPREVEALTEAEKASNYRLACRARVISPPQPPPEGGKKDQTPPPLGGGGGGETSKSPWPQSKSTPTRPSEPGSGIARATRRWDWP